MASVHRGAAAVNRADTAVCRHVDCGKRFDLSRYSNQRRTSRKTREGRHLFCSSRCRKAHSRRMIALRGGVTGGGVTGGVTEQGATMVAGGVTSLEITKQNQQALTPKITTEEPPSAPRRGHPKAIPDAVYPGMWRVQWHDGRVSDMANLTRINDAIAGFVGSP